jgi:hypothetical protein
LNVFFEQHFHRFASKIAELYSTSLIYTHIISGIIITYYIDVRVHKRDECLNDVRSVVEEGQIQQQLSQTANSNGRQRALADVGVLVAHGTLDQVVQVLQIFLIRCQKGRFEFTQFFHVF